MSNETKENNSNRDYQIPVEGSLGLLALGAKGIDLWRRKRDEIIRTQSHEQNTPDSTDEKK